MADQKVSNERKKELEQLDPFQENLIKAMAFLKTHQKTFMLAAGGLLAVILIFSAVMTSIKRSENTAAVLVSSAIAEYEREADPVKGYQSVQGDFDKIFKEYGNTSAGERARISFAKICYNASKYDQSLMHYQHALDLFDKDPLMKNFLLAALGHVSISKKDFKAAQDYFRQIEASDVNLLKDEAVYTLGMIYEASDKLVESRKQYEKIISDHKDSIYFAMAQSKVAEIR